MGSKTFYVSVYVYDANEDITFTYVGTLKELQADMAERLGARQGWSGIASLDPLERLGVQRYYLLDHERVSYRLHQRTVTAA